MSPGWPARLEHGPVGLRPFRVRDATAWSDVRIRNEAWLAPWEGRPESQPYATWAERHSTAVFAAMLRSMRKEARAGRSLPFAITYDGRLAGQLTCNGVVRGAFDNAYVGYWVDGALAGRGILPTALAMVVDHCFGAVGLHRVEANVRPENAASRRVVEKLGFREEGLHQRYLYIDGGWRDHISYAVTREDVPDGMLRRWDETRNRSTHR
ncbi:MAG: GCN5-related N-acetyltransferase [Frankiales bacterium]|jgi:ribosomal-protein-alanine N-acetyltransferase|nr:GCN5-related N-acetyltransferase [Frankiales bacterium]